MKEEGLYALEKGVEPSSSFFTSSKLKGSAWLIVMWGLFLFIQFAAISCDRHDAGGDMIALEQEVRDMRQCQRKADNLNFYLHKNNAEKLIKNYEGKKSSLSEENQHKFLLSKSYYFLVYSDYLLQIGNRREAIKVVDSLSQDKYLNLNADTMLWLNYLAHQGQASYYPYSIKKHRKNIERGYDCLMQCYIFASRNQIDKYKAVSMQILSQYLLIDSIVGVVKEFDPSSLRYINEDGVADTLLAGNLAERALNIFLKQKDYYYTANAWRNLATCYFYIGDANMSLQCLNNALANPALDSMPDLKASISEQMSMSYAALDDKRMSDHYRNQYLDLQDSTRQDRQYEARIITLENTTHRIWMLVALAFMVFVMLCVIVVVLVKLRNRKSVKVGEKVDFDSMRDELSMLRLQYSDAQRAMVEQRARVSIISGMLSLIERLRHAVENKDYAYAREITNDIEQQNAMLTQWIKLQGQGSVKPKIETFPISDILSILKQSSANLAAQGIVLKIDSDDTPDDDTVMVRGDRSLTLFIINTLIDNARKAIENKGEITVTTSKRDDYLAICVSDTGKGMTPLQVEHLFDVKSLKEVQEEGKGGYGFGLQNCRGIIERYRKISSIFSVCKIEAKSLLGKGTTITFTLPRVLNTLLMLFAMSLSISTFAQTEKDIERYADSLYKCNVEGRFHDAILYADTCKTITKNSLDVSEDKAPTYLSIYNETAVAALALHQWHRYQYYNYLYTQLYKQTTADKTLPNYSKKKQQGELIANMAMLVVLLLIVSLFPLTWFVYMRPLLRQRKETRKLKINLQEEIDRTQMEYDRLHVQNNIVSNQLSAVKHETMYYPSRIKQLLSDTADETETFVQLKDTIAYYSSLYATLSNQMIADDSTQSPFQVTIYSSEALRQASSESQLPIHLIANQELITYLLLLLKRHNGGVAPELTVEEETEGKTGGKGYVSLRFAMSESSITEDNISTLFSSSTVHTDYLVMRQIVRETADATNCYASGIRAVMDNNVPYIVVTLPCASVA